MNWEFTDIHCHIIPDVDDGAAAMEASLQLVDEAYAEGIRRMIATPHFGVINPQYDSERVAGKFDDLVNAVAEIHPDMELYMGNEIFLAPGYPDGLKDGLSNTLAGSSYVLVEFPMDIDYEFIYHSFRRLMVNGYTPVFAHAERYQHVYRNIKGLAELVNMGVLIQVNSRSVGAPENLRNLGISNDSCNDDSEHNIRITDPGIRNGLLNRFFGNSRKLNKYEKFVAELLKAGYVNFIATDCHDMPGRHPVMRAAAERVIELVGEESAARIFIDNPQFILNEEDR